MHPRWLASIAIAVLLCASLSADKKKLGQAYKLKPDQVAELTDVRLTTAHENCENWAVAAGLEMMLRAQGVKLAQSFWVTRLSGGEVCTPDLPSIDAIAKEVNRDFVLDDGRHVHLELNFTSGAPNQIDAILAGLQHQQVSMLFWRGHAWYLSGLLYDEYVGLDGGRLFEVKELRLANTFARQPGTAFVRGRDDASEIGGVLSVSVVPQ
ncbi:MAG TPA: hypothetical protein VHN74_16610 [Candidatus Angelobacter sp.]|jgi:hypothetical protein|nr:hypothetical protein [Candidatus Angelobacter sp.]